MTNEELQQQLDEVIDKLKKAHQNKNHKQISKYIKKLNNLWKIASVTMLKNAEDAGLYSPDNS